MTLRAAWAGGVLAALIAAGAGASDAPDQSLRPVLRPVLAPVLLPETDPAPDAAPQVAMAATLPELMSVAPIPNDQLEQFEQPDLPATRPAERPVSDQLIAVAARVPTDPVYSPDASLHPNDRPDSVVQLALFGKRKKRKGSVCGDIDIQGEKVGNYGKGGGCFIQNAVRVKSVSGVQLSQTALMTCDTAKALKNWVDKGVQPAFGKKVVEMKVAAHYACRTRNNKAGAKLSEHAKGRAIDISGFTLKNGKQVTVLGDWGKGSDGKALRKVHKAACGPFGTVLGPGSDGYHRDHIHMDTARYRNGTYCR